MVAPSRLAHSSPPTRRIQGCTARPRPQTPTQRRFDYLSSVCATSAVAAAAGGAAVAVSARSSFDLPIHQVGDQKLPRR